MNFIFNIGRRSSPSKQNITLAYRSMQLIFTLPFAFYVFCVWAHSSLVFVVFIFHFDAFILCSRLLCRGLQDIISMSLMSHELVVILHFCLLCCQCLIFSDVFDVKNRSLLSVRAPPLDLHELRLSVASLWGSRVDFEGNASLTCFVDKTEQKLCRTCIEVHVWLKHKIISHEVKCYSCYQIMFIVMCSCAFLTKQMCLHGRHLPAFT